MQEIKILLIGLFLKIKSKLFFLKKRKKKSKRKFG